MRLSAATPTRATERPTSSSRTHLAESSCSSSRLAQARASDLVSELDDEEAPAVILTGAIASALASAMTEWKRHNEAYRAVLDALTPKDRGSLSAAALLQARRNAEARRELLEEFPALTSAEVADAANSRAANRASLANRWREEGKIFAIRLGDQQLYPAFQFDGHGRPLAVITTVLERLDESHLNDWQTALWFTSPTGWLGGRRPVDLLRDQPDDVALAAAREVESLSPSTLVPVPPDSRTIDPLITPWPSGKQLSRCHPSTFGATEFNPRAGTPGRFRPVRTGRRVVPTFYAADGAAGAISETVFHDVPVDSTTKRVRIARFETVLLSTIAPRRELRLIRLHGHGVHRLRASRAQLIESEADCYPQLASWGQALHDCPVNADGLLWRSRQYDDSYACLLFGDRVGRRELEVTAPSLPLALGRGLELLTELAEDAEIALIA